MDEDEENSAGQEMFNIAGRLAEFKKSKRTTKVDTNQPLDLDLLLGSPPKKKSKTTSKKEGKKKTVTEKKPKTKQPAHHSSSSDEDKSDELWEEEEQEEVDEVEETAMAEAAWQTSVSQLRNRNRNQRLIACTTRHDDETNLLSYLASNQSSEQIVISPSPSEPAGENPGKTVWVKWKFSKMIKFELQKFQTFEVIFKHYAAREKVPVEKISLETDGGRQVYPHDTAEAIGLDRNAVLEGCILCDALEGTGEENDGKLEVKIQLPDKRDNMVVRVGRDEPMKHLMLKVAESLSLPPEVLRFHFDGEVVEEDQTPQELDLDGGEVFDLKILK